MIVTLRDDSMLDIWRRAAGFEPSLSEASVERFDSLDIDTALRRRMRAWYLDLIATGDSSLLRADDIGSRASLTAGSRRGEWLIKLPPDTGRVLGIDIEGHGALPITEEKDTPIPDNPYVRIGGRMKAVLTNDRRAIRLYGPETPKIHRLMAVTIPEDDIYILDERALGLIPEGYQ